MQQTLVKNKKTSAFIALWTLYFLNVFSRLVFSALAPKICQNLNINTFDLGNLYFFMAFGFGISLFSSQFLSSYIYHRSVILYSSLSIGLSLLFASNCSSYFLFKISYFLIGISSGFFLPSAIALLINIFSKDNLGKVFGFFGLAQGLSFISAAYFSKITLSYKSTIQFTAYLSFFLALISFLILKNFNQKNEKVDLSFLKTLLNLPSFWITIILSGLITGLNVGVYNMIFSYFSKSSLNNYHSYIGFARTLGLISTVAGGFIVDKFGIKNALKYGLFVAGILTALLGIVDIKYSAIIFCFHAPIAICLNPVLHVAISNLASPGQNASVISIISSIGFIIGTGFIPQIIGYLGSINFYSYGFIIFGFIIIFKATLLSFEKYSNHLPSKLISSNLND